MSSTAHTDAPAELAAILACLDQMQAQDVVCLEIGSQSPLADNIVICSSKSARHGRSLCQELLTQVKSDPKARVEGDDFAEWIVLDYHHTMVHIMLPAVRDYYKLERLWDTNIPAS
jgi:ribosome-associated protein